MLKNLCLILNFMSFMTVKSLITVTQILTKASIPSLNRLHQMQQQKLSLSLKEH